VKIKFDFFKLIISLKIKIMEHQEQIKIKRYKKSDKYKNNFSKTGGFTKKHIRNLEYKKEQSKLNK
jgi:hypothetical protein